MNFKKLLLGSVVLTTFSVSIILFNISCNKESDAQPQSQTFCMGPQPKFQFKANGKLYVCDPVFDKRIGWIEPNNTDIDEIGYTPSLTTGSNGTTLHGRVITSAGKEISINLFLKNTSTLPVGSYNENNIGSDSRFEEFDNNGYNNSTHTITISRVSNGTADGSFTGTVRTTNTNPIKTVTITEGVFSNVPILQY